MHLSNDRDHYGLAALAVGQFGLGLRVHSLGYYDTWYQQGLWWHKGIGLMLRLVWRWGNLRPDESPIHKSYRRRLAEMSHGGCPTCCSSW